MQSLSKIDGGVGLWDYGMQDFKDWLTDLHLVDIRAVGPHLTWWDSHLSNPTYKKLDRALVNNLWLDSFPNSQVIFSPRELSDHCPMVVYSGQVLPFLPKPFQFFNFMTGLDNFLGVVQEAWSTHCSGDPLQILSGKLRAVKRALMSLNKQNGNLTSNVENIKDSLHSTQLALDSRPSDINLLNLQWS